MKYDIIINEASKTGEGTARYDELRKILRESGAEYRVHRTMYPGHGTVIARELSKSDERAVNIIVMGGDGTLNEVLNGIADFEKVRLGLIPNGSANDFATVAGISRDLEKEVKNIIAGTGRPGRVDIGAVSYRSDGKTKHRIFGISSGLGLDAIVCKKTFTSKLKKFLNRFGLGRLTYAILTVQSLFFMQTATAVIEGIADNGSKITPYECKNLIFAAVMNGKCEGGGVPMAPLAKIDNGTLSLSTASDIPKWLTFLLFPVLLIGKQSLIKGFDLKRFKKLVIRLDKPFTLHADGEYCGEVNGATFEVMQGKLQLLNRS